MKESIFMRVLFCKIHCPFICFCKPSAAHLYTSGALKLENTPQPQPQPQPQAPPSSSVVSVSDQQLSIGETSQQVKEEDLDLDGKQQSENVSKSCIKKPPFGPNASKDIDKKKVQWIDNIGKELAEIREFESSETGDTDNEDENRGCVCTIL